MRSKDFKPGQLVWLSQLVDDWVRGYLQTERGYPTAIDLSKGLPCTVIRRALAKDYGTYARHTHHGKSTGRRIAESAWLVLYNGAPTLIDERWLCKRRYTSKKVPP
jgi:hypothetical protein